LDADHVDARALVLDDLFFESLIIMDSDEWNIFTAAAADSYYKYPRDEDY
jgi:hypothetical protein